jgi:hypothetical protein
MPRESWTPLPVGRFPAVIERIVAALQLREAPSEDLAALVADLRRTANSPIDPQPGRVWDPQDEIVIDAEVSPTTGEVLVRPSPTRGSSGGPEWLVLSSGEVLCSDDDSTADLPQWSR